MSVRLAVRENDEIEHEFIFCEAHHYNTIWFAFGVLIGEDSAHEVSSLVWCDVGHCPSREGSHDCCFDLLVLDCQED